MSLKTMLSGTLVTAALLAVGLVVDKTPAQGAQLYFSASPERVVVNQAYENISWTLGGVDSPQVESVEANLEHTSTRETGDFDYATDGDTSGTFRIYDFDQMGRYTVYGPAYDQDFNEMSVAPTYITIKRASRSALTATRSDRYVRLRAVTKRYNGGYPMWAAHRGATVAYQRYSGGSWHAIGRRTVPSNGVTKLAVKRATRARYRVVVGQTGTVWNSASAAVRR